MDAFRRFTDPLHSLEAAMRAYLRAKEVLFGRGPFLLIACMPKSGSTFLKTALEFATGYGNAVLTSAFERTEQELYLPRLIEHSARPTVTQQHVRATAENLRLMCRFRIRPVILVRDLADVIVSIRDYLLEEGEANFPSLYATGYFRELNEQEQFDFLIAFAMPWYFNFYVSWNDATMSGQVDALWLRYEDLREDWHSGIRSVLSHQGITTSDDDIDAAIAAAYGKGKRATRFNQGVQGRGRTALNDRQRDQLEHMASFYPWVDFTWLGLRQQSGQGAHGASV